MKFFCSSLDIRDNLKVAFFGKISLKIELCHFYIWYYQYDRLIQQSFFEATASLSNSSREKSINTTERQAQAH